MKVLLIILLIVPEILIAQELAATLKLKDGTFIVNAPSGRNWTKNRNIVTSGGFDVYPAKKQLVIDDSNVKNVKYFGKWRISKEPVVGPSDNSCNCSWGGNPKDSMVFRFTNAKRLEWYGERMNLHGIVDIYFDNKKVATVDTYDERNLTPTLNWSKDNIDPHVIHTFKLVPTGRKNSKSSGTNIVNHYIKIGDFGEDTPPPKPTKPPPVATTENPVQVGEILITASGYQYQPEINLVFPPRQVMDNDLTTKWAALGEDQWMIFSLPEKKLLKSAEIAWSASRENYFGLEVSEDSASWKTIYDNKASAMGKDYQPFDFADIEARYVKLLTKGNKDSGWNSVTEVRLHYTDIAEPPIVTPPIIPDTKYYAIVREGKFKVYIDAELDEGEHNEYEKAIQHAIKAKAQNPGKRITIESPPRRVDIE